VLGPNGAGKSTLLRALAQIGGHRRTGQVLLDGQPAGHRQMRAALAEETALLLHGRIREHGPTPQVLDQPVDIACARLVGYTNLLPPALAGQPDLLVARPERCHLLPPGTAPPPDSITVRGTVRRAVPLGGGTRVDLDPEPSGDTLACLVPADSELEVQPGHRVTVTIATADLRPVVARHPATTRNTETLSGREQVPHVATDAPG
jgi:ABC-type sulfate/molybdate transport systems ATPase subunit